MAEEPVAIPTTGPLSGLTMLNDVNNADLALATLQSGASPPTAAALGISSLAGVLWHDTGTNTIKLRDQADTTWIVIGTVNETTKSFAAGIVIDANDTTAGPLAAKLLAGANVTLSIGNSGGNETLTVAVPLGALAKENIGNGLQDDGSGNLIPKLADGTAVAAAGLVTVPAGAVAHFAMTAPPAGWLAADGSAVPRTTYGALFAAIGTAYGAGDGSTTFNLPDLRGVFVRGYDNGRGLDPDRAGAFGTYEADSFAAHTHVQSEPTGAGSASGYTSSAASTGTSAGWLTAATGGTETRPKNVNLLACIKY